MPYVVTMIKPRGGVTNADRCKAVIPTVDISKLRTLTTGEIPMGFSFYDRAEQQRRRPEGEDLSYRLSRPDVIDRYPFKPSAEFGSGSSHDIAFKIATFCVPICHINTAEGGTDTVYAYGQTKESCLARAIRVINTIDQESEWQIHLPNYQFLECKVAAGKEITLQYKEQCGSIDNRPGRKLRKIRNKLEEHGLNNVSFPSLFTEESVSAAAAARPRETSASEEVNHFVNELLNEAQRDEAITKLAQIFNSNRGDDEELVFEILSQNTALVRFLASLPSDNEHFSAIISGAFGDGSEDDISKAIATIAKEKSVNDAVSFLQKCGEACKSASVFDHVRANAIYHIIKKSGVSVAIVFFKEYMKGQQPGVQEDFLKSFYSIVRRLGKDGIEAANSFQEQYYQDAVLTPQGGRLFAGSVEQPSAPEPAAAAAAAAAPEPAAAAAAAPEPAAAAAAAPEPAAAAAAAAAPAPTASQQPGRR